MGANRSKEKEIQFREEEKKEIEDLEKVEKPTFVHGFKYAFSGIVCLFKYSLWKVLLPEYIVMFSVGIAFVAILVTLMIVASFTPTTVMFNIIIGTEFFFGVVMVIIQLVIFWPGLYKLEVLTEVSFYGGVMQIDWCFMKDIPWKKVFKFMLYTLITSTIIGSCVSVIMGILIGFSLLIGFLIPGAFIISYFISFSVGFLLMGFVFGLNCICIVYNAKNDLFGGLKFILKNFAISAGFSLGLLILYLIPLFPFIIIVIGIISATKLLLHLESTQKLSVPFQYSTLMSDVVI